MKKLLLFVMMLSMAASVLAVEVEIDGLWYELVSKTKEAKVTNVGYNGYIVIPEIVEYEGASYSVTSIGSKAFYSCSGITSVAIPNSVTSIEKDAFSYCFGLTSVRISDLEAWCKISFVNDRSNPLYYAHHLFLNGEEIKDLVIPNSVTSIGSNAFYGCSGLTSVTIPNSVTSIVSSAFQGCSGLTSVTIGNSVTNIGSNAFYSCSGITSVTIPNSVKIIGKGAFQDCFGLTSVTIGNSVTSIVSSASQGCSGLTSVTIGNSVASIGIGAFYGCSRLTSITFPNSVTSIGEQAFASCPELTDVYCYAENVPNTKGDAFQDSYIEYATLHVPDASVNAYSQVEPWKNFKEIVRLNGTKPDDPETPKCEKPTISYDKGQLKFTSATEGAEFITDISNSDIKKHYDANISLTATYNISVYATKSGYDNSDVATATLCWIDLEPKTEGITDGVAQIPSKAMLVQSEGGILKVEGIDDGTPVSIFTPDGKQAGSAVCRNGAALVGTNIQPGNVAIVRIGEKSVKVVVK